MQWAGFSFNRELLGSIRQSISCFRRSNGGIIPNGRDGIQIFCTVKWSPTCAALECVWKCEFCSKWFLAAPLVTPLRPQSDFCWWFFPALSHISQVIQTIRELDTEQALSYPVNDGFSMEATQCWSYRQQSGIQGGNCNSILELEEQVVPFPSNTKEVFIGLKIQQGNSQ